MELQIVEFHLTILRCSERVSGEGNITADATELTFPCIKVGTCSSQWIVLKNSSDTEERVIVIIQFIKKKKKNSSI